MYHQNIIILLYMAYPHGPLGALTKECSPSKLTKSHPALVSGGRA